MSTEANGAAISAHDGEGTRHRHYHNIARLLKEYTGVMYEIAHHIATYLDAPEKRPKARLPVSVFLAVRRYRSVWEEVRDVARFASQMLVHYQLDEAEAAELRLRLADGENSIETTGALINGLREEHGPVVGEPVTPTELDALVRQILSALHASR